MAAGYCPFSPTFISDFGKKDGSVLGIKYYKVDDEVGSITKIILEGALGSNVKSGGLPEAIVQKLIVGAVVAILEQAPFRACAFEGGEQTGRPSKVF